MLTRLGEAPVAGVSMGNVALLRLDVAGGLAPGNKQFKLGANLAAARRLGINRLVSFGGAWSNHLHALAAVGAEQGFATVGIVRGDERGAESATLADARRWGMQIVRVSRKEYRRRHDIFHIFRQRTHDMPGRICAGFYFFGDNLPDPRQLIIGQNFKYLERLLACRSGRELVDGGYARDVALAAESETSEIVPRLVNGAYVG